MDTYVSLLDLPTTTTSNDADYVVIGQSSSAKKISKENLLNSVNTAIGDVTDLETTAPDLVGAINEVKGSVTGVSVVGKTLVFGGGE